MHIDSVLVPLCRLRLHLDSLLDRLLSSLSEECQQRGANSVFGQFVGAPLVSTETGEVISTQQVEDAVVSGDESIVIKDTATGLLIPGPSARMKLPDSSAGMVPPNHTIHPRTGRVVPMEGNICFDPISQIMVFTSDVSSKDGIPIREEPLIPFVCYPLSIETGQPVETGLTVANKPSDVRLGGTMKDPFTGLHVPICAVTIHPHSNSILPVGGIHRDPLSNLPVPIEIGSMMLDPLTDRPVPILGVHIEPHSGQVVPTGGSIATIEYDKPIQKTILIGERFTEPLSQLPKRITSVYVEVENGELIPAHGGYSALLDTDELSQEKAVANSLQYIRDLMCAMSHSEPGEQLRTNLQEEMAKFDASCKDLMASRSWNQTHYLQSVHRLHLKREASDQVAFNGGSPGYMEFKPTGQPLPLLVGMAIPDPAGMGIQVRNKERFFLRLFCKQQSHCELLLLTFQVPILGYEVDPISGTAEPLAGTMESAQGDGTIPITIGEQAYDQASGQLAPVNGIRKNPETGVAIPVIQGLLAGAKKKPHVSNTVVSTH